MARIAARPPIDSRIMRPMSSVSSYFHKISAATKKIKQEMIQNRKITRLHFTKLAFSHTVFTLNTISPISRALMYSL
jgi:hypothetical protein